MAASPLRPVLDLMVQYAAYHRDKRNIATHFIGIPLIVFAIGVLLARVPVAGFTVAWLAWGIGAFVVGWIFQFVGHYYEGKKPAFVDDIVGLLVGPMFVVGEWLFAAGWGRDLLAQIEAQVGPTHIRDRAAPAG